ncbi:MAG: DUF2442 domain-containing protein [Planctomycetota bacterium]|jgi:hypothetical protein
MDAAHEVEDMSFTGTVMRLRVDCQDYEVNIDSQSERLAGASPEERANFVVSPSGYGIHWPDLDEDLSVDCLIGAKHERPPGHAKTG